MQAKRTHSLALAASMVVLLHLAAHGAATDTRVLLESYLRYVLAERTTAQAQTLEPTGTDADRAQVAQAVKVWSDGVKQRIRADLSRQFGDQARPRFEAFVNEYAAAEARADAGFLIQTVVEASVEPPPSDYRALRTWAVGTWLKADVESGSDLLSEIQTWLTVKGREPDVPDLGPWLAARLERQPSVAVASSGEGPALPAAPPKRRNPLAAAEANVEPYQPAAEAQAPGNPLDALHASRQDRRDRALEDAQAGMQQVAAERQAAEQEWAAKKMARAQAEAEGLRRQADKLAASEEQAQQQRQNSWGAKLKNLAATTITAGTGAFFGGLGAMAGAQAADALFD